MRYNWITRRTEDFSGFMKSIKTEAFLLRGKCILVLIYYSDKDEMLVHFSVVFTQIAIVIHVLQIDTG